MDTSAFTVYLLISTTVYLNAITLLQIDFLFLIDHPHDFYQATYKHKLLIQRTVAMYYMFHVSLIYPVDYPTKDLRRRLSLLKLGVTIFTKFSPNSCQKMQLVNVSGFVRCYSKLLNVMISIPPDNFKLVTRNTRGYQPHLRCLQSACDSYCYSFFHLLSDSW